MGILDKVRPCLPKRVCFMPSFEIGLKVCKIHFLCIDDVGVVTSNEIKSNFSRSSQTTTSMIFIAN